MSDTLGGLRQLSCGNLEVYSGYALYTPQGPDFQFFSFFINNALWIHFIPLDNHIWGTWGLLWAL